MRLIDADELKKELAKNITIWTFNVIYDGILAEIIDNAPTVDNPYQEGHIDGMLQAEKLYARPQGEWKHPYSTDIACECSNCHLQMPITDYFNFCPNCGSDMRGDNNG